MKSKGSVVKGQGSQRWVSLGILLRARLRKPSTGAISVETTKHFASSPDWKSKSCACFEGGEGGRSDTFGCSDQALEFAHFLFFYLHECAPTFLDSAREGGMVECWAVGSDCRFSKRRNFGGQARRA